MGRISIGEGVSFQNRNSSGRGAFKVTLSSSPTLSTDVITKVPFDTIVIDRDGWFDNVTNFRYTPKIAGDYFFGFISKSSIFPGADANVWTIYVFTNDTDFVLTNERFGGAGSRSATLVQSTFLNGSTDFIDFRVSQNTGGDETIDTSVEETYAFGYLVHAT